MTGLTILLLRQSLHLERQKDSQPSKLVVLSQRMSKRINSIIEPRHLDSEKGKALTALEDLRLRTDITWNLLLKKRETNRRRPQAFSELLKRHIALELDVKTSTRQLYRQVLCTQMARIRALEHTQMARFWLVSMLVRPLWRNVSSTSTMSGMRLGKPYQALVTMTRVLPSTRKAPTYPHRWATQRPPGLILVGAGKT